MSDDAGSGSASSSSGSDGAKIQFDDIVGQIHADPAKPQGATLLSGFVGKSDAEGRIRIYPDVSFGTWFDVAEADVVHSVPLSKESSPLGGSHVWVKSGAEIKPGSSGGAAGAAAPGAITQPVWLCPTMFAATCPVCPPSIGCPPGAAAAAAAYTPPPTNVGPTCPGGDCTFFGCPTMHGMTCPRHICGETMPPTVHHLTCPRFICTETMPTPTATFYQTCGVQCQSGPLTIVCTQHAGCQQAGGVQAQAHVMPTPTATFFHTCGLRCPSGVATIVCTHHPGCRQPSGIETLVCTYYPGCQQHGTAQAQAAPVSLATVCPTIGQHTCPHTVCPDAACNSGVLTIVCTHACQQQGFGAAQIHPTTDPTRLTRCFICPPETIPGPYGAPQTRSGVFCPYGA